jgi:hypothetical protein
MGVEPRIIKGSADQRFYTGAAIVAALIVLAGFARSYYLKIPLGGPPPWAPVMSPLLHMHGLVMTSWFLLFVVQARLIATRRTPLHRRLGVFGGLLAATMLVLGTVLAITQAKLGRTPGPPPLKFLVIPLGDLLVFGILVGLGLYLRNRPQIHRRLMLLATLSILGAAVARLPIGFIETGGPLVFYGLVDLCVLACVAYDTVKNRRLHPAFALGALFIIASHPLRLMLAGTDTWMQFATWLTR